MSKINVLSTELSNLIGAGEVIESIYSIIKELVENSIDANSTSIEIQLTDSGFGEIVVIDNGEGMDKEDIKLSFVRHATSKISNKHDLFRINSLGFRGEAIPSIASVSEIKIKSSTDGEIGYYITEKGSSIIEQGETPMNKGTVISVKKLFYNTPARLKYMKSPNIELANVCEVVDKIALANPNIRFKLSNNKKVLLNTIGNNDVPSILSQVYGNEIYENIISFNYVDSSFNIKGYLVKPFINRTKRSNITLIVNGRSVKNNSIINSIIEGYNTLIPIGRFPICLINILIDPLLIDVNVHPAKSEIKFSCENELKEVLKKKIQEELFKSNLIPSIKESFIKEEQNNYNTEFNNNNSLNSSFTDTIEEQQISYNEFNSKPISNDEEDFVSFSDFVENSFSDNTNTNLESNIEENSFKQEEIKFIESKLPYLEYIGQYNGTYLIMQSTDSLYLIDQHAAMERIRYEENYVKLGSPKFESQMLLFPINFELTKRESIFLKDHIADFTNLGFEIQESGINSFFIRSIPTWINPNDIDIVPEKIISFILQNEEINISKIRDSLAKLISCKSSIKANHKINYQEVYRLISDLGKCENPFTCPHGRPTIIKFTNYEIEKMFKRVI